MVFLASNQASFITGVTPPGNGGYMAFGAIQDAYTLADFPADGLFHQQIKAPVRRV